MIEINVSYKRIVRQVGHLPEVISRCTVSKIQKNRGHVRLITIECRLYSSWLYCASSQVLTFWRKPQWLEYITAASVNTKHCSGTISVVKAAVVRRSG